MHRIYQRWVLLVSLALLPLSSGTAYPQATAQPDGSAGGVHPLASKEEMIRDRFERFQDRVFRLREQLGDVEPENAIRLGRVLERSGELGLADELDEIIRLLRDPGGFSEARDAQMKWVQDANRLLDILLERDSDNEARKREIDRLDEYKREISTLLNREQAARDAAAGAAHARALAEQLKAAAQRLDALLDQQSEISKQTSGAEGTPGRSGLEKQSKDERDLARETAELADDLRKLSELKPDESADSSAAQAAREKAKSAGESVSGGAESMSQASQSLQQNNSGSASKEQKEAEEALRRARDRLEQAIAELEQQQKLGEQSAEQRSVAKDTGSLGDQMRQDASQGQQGQQGQQSPQSGQQSPSTPGQQSLDQAERDMNQAADKLDADQPSSATDNQDSAIENLEQARRELEEALSQLRQEEREEMLRDLEARFREMLSKQREINAETVALDEVGRDSFKRSEQLQLAELSVAQRSLSGQAARCVHILDEEGTTIVFPRVLGQISEDMAVVAGRLGDMLVARLTQRIEQEIVDTLEQLLEAVKQMQQDNEQSGGMSSQSGDGKDQPLLPTSAELKLLRSSQVRVNERTSMIEAARVDQAQPEEGMAQAFDITARRQAECAEIAKEMRDLQHQP